MKNGIWVWPADPRFQLKTLKKVAKSGYLARALIALAKSKDGLSNSELDDAISDNSEWMTLWVVRQLTALGFIELSVDLFGEPAKYRLTELGRNANSYVTGQPLPPKPQPPQSPAQAPAQAQPVAPTPKP
jgi:hypothetical protein